MTLIGESSELSSGRVVASWKRPVKLTFSVVTSLAIVYSIVSCFSLRLSTDPPGIQSQIGQQIFTVRRSDDSIVFGVVAEFLNVSFFLLTL